MMSEIGEKFNIPGKIMLCEKLDTGLINESFRVVFSDDKGNEKSYLFQKLNRHAFEKYEEVMSNIFKVTSYLKQNYPEERILNFHISKTGKNYYEFGDGNIWRTADWIESVTFRNTDDICCLKEAGRAYGHFLKLLSGFDAGSVSVTIPDFHNTGKILEKFRSVVRTVSDGEISDVMKETEYLLEGFDKFTAVQKAYSEGKLPLRVVHNDTKLSNILFSGDSKKAEAVIDLDTVMPGMAAYDFGDAVRSAAITGSETGQTAWNIDFDKEKFKAFSAGYLGETAEILTEYEKELLVPAAYSVAAELSARYFIDYFTKGNYFAVSTPAELLVKARQQARLSEIILNRSDELTEICFSCT